MQDLQTLDHPGNLILAAIAPEHFGRMEHLFTTVPLRMRETLQEAGESPDFVYFPTSGIISVLTVMENGMMIEFATVGREGTTGVPPFLEMGDSNMALISQVPGEALRMATSDFRAEVARTPSFAAIMGRYSGVMLALVAQSAACNRAHHVDERCARWLLMTHDQSAGDSFPITQEFLAQMLGVSRPSVTLAAAALQDAGLIRYHRGAMTIIDRPGLERASCECYAVIHERFVEAAISVIPRLAALDGYLPGAAAGDIGTTDGHRGRSELRRAC
jgi:CRP-like cAMP-binding protein